MGQFSAEICCSPGQFSVEINSQTYPSLSKVALAITGTRWNGPKFFGLRDNPSKRSTA